MVGCSRGIRDNVAEDGAVTADVLFESGVVVSMRGSTLCRRDGVVSDGVGDNNVEAVALHIGLVVVIGDPYAATISRVFIIHMPVSRQLVQGPHP